MTYKTYIQCRMCREEYAPAGKELCSDCQKIRDYRDETRRYPCPVCGVDSGYACFTRYWEEGMYGGGSWIAEQGDQVHEERHPDYVPSEPAPKRQSFWKQAWHFCFGEREEVC